jgi:hypothetical protein
LQNQELIDEPLQYVDIAEWQNELFEGEEAELEKSIGEEKFINLEKWQLPYESQPTVKPEFEPKFISLAFDSETVAKLEAIAQKYNTSISALLQACWTFFSGVLPDSQMLLLARIVMGEIMKNWNQR